MVSPRPKPDNTKRPDPPIRTGNTINPQGLVEGECPLNTNYNPFASKKKLEISNAELLVRIHKLESQVKVLTECVDALLANKTKEGGV